MLAAGAAKTNGEIALAFVDVVREQVYQQIGDAGNELPRLRKRANVFGDTWMASRKRPEFRHEVRIGQEANVEDQVGLLGDSVAEAEAYTGNQNAFFGGLLAEECADVGA